MTDDQDMAELNGLAFSVVRLIQSGHLDRHLVAIGLACRDREAALRRNRRASEPTDGLAGHRPTAYILDEVLEDER